MVVLVSDGVPVPASAMDSPPNASRERWWLVRWWHWGHEAPLKPAAPRSASHRWWRPELVLAAMVAVYLALFGWLTWLQQANFGTFDFDMGVFDQEIWLAARHLNPFITIRGLTMWANHVNPIVYLLVPFYWLGAGPHFLYLVQVGAFAFAAVPLWLLARDRWSNPWLALGVPAAWLLYPAVEWMTWWPFQPEYLAVPAFIYAYWFAVRRRWVWYAICVVLVLACKEDAALPVMALGLLLAFRQRRRAGLLTLAGALGWFLLCVEVIMPAATGSNAPFFLYQYSELGGSVGQIAWNVLRHPSRLLGQIFSAAKGKYYLQVFMPVAALCVLAPTTLVLVVPTLLINVTNNQGYPASIHYQYTAFIAAGVFLAVIEGVAHFRGPRLVSWRVPLVAALCACAFASNVLWSPSPLNHKEYASGIWALSPTPRASEAARLVKMIPASAGVSASYNLVPHLSHRDQIYSWPNPWFRSNYGISNTQPPENPARVQYILVDTSALSVVNQDLLQFLTQRGGAFRVLADRDGIVLARRVS